MLLPVPVPSELSATVIVSGCPLACSIQFFKARALSSALLPVTSNCNAEALEDPFAVYVLERPAPSMMTIVWSADESVSVKIIVDVAAVELRVTPLSVRLPRVLVIDVDPPK